jgi:hypothetical protein
VTGIGCPPAAGTSQTALGARLPKMKVLKTNSGFPDT